MKDLYDITESLLDDEEEVITRMSSKEDDLLWTSTRTKYEAALKRRYKRKYPCDCLGRKVFEKDWILIGWSLWRIIDIKPDGPEGSGKYLYSLEGCDNKFKDVRTGDSMSTFKKIMNKIAFAENLSA